jgi:hypothetical protein
MRMTRKIAKMRMFGIEQLFLLKTLSALPVCNIIILWILLEVQGGGWVSCVLSYCYYEWFIFNPK